MEVSSSHQIYVFGLCVVSGILCGVFFDVQRSIRKISFAGGIRTALEDVLFAVVCIAVTLALSFHFNNGEMRYYQIMGSVSGALFYGAFLSSAVMRMLKMLYRGIELFVIKPVIKICPIILFPIKKILLISKRIYSKVMRIVKRLILNVRKYKKRLKKNIKLL